MGRVSSRLVPRLSRLVPSHGPHMGQLVEIMSRLMGQLVGISGDSSTPLVASLSLPKPTPPCLLLFMVILTPLMEESGNVVIVRRFLVVIELPAIGKNILNA